MKKSILLFLLAFAGHLNAQVLETKNWCLSQCNIVGDELKNTELIFLQMKNDSIRRLMTNAEILKFPLRIGIIQSDTSKVQVEEFKVRKAIDDLNKSFAEVGFVFYIERVDVIVSNLHLEDLSADFYGKYNEFSDRYDQKDMLSLYIFEHGLAFCNITETSIACGRTGGFSYVLSNRTNNLVVSRFDLEDPKVVAHEFGHFFGLYHNFEEMQFGKDDFDPKTCDSVGDRICDTPPDPGVVFEVYVNYSKCEMLGLRHQNGHEYKPLLQNYMSYYKPCYLKEYSFTPDQVRYLRLAGYSDLRKKFSR